MTPVTRSIDTEELQIHYELAGPENGPPVLLLHGWPDDVRTWDAVVQPLTEHGYRTVVPHLRGFGLTRFHNRAIPRNAQPTALAADAQSLLQALDLRETIVVGHDWGARTAYTLAALWPERLRRLVACSVPHQPEQPRGDQIPPEQLQAYGYQWLLNTEQGRQTLLDNHLDFCQHLWDTWSPDWNDKPADFRQTSASWANEDWVDITLHSYRVRWNNASVDERWSDLEARFKQSSDIPVPTVHLHGERDGATLAAHLPDDSARFTAGHKRILIPGAGHFLPRERPDAVVQAVLARSFP